MKWMRCTYSVQHHQYACSSKHHEHQDGHEADDATHTADLDLPLPLKSFGGINLDLFELWNVNCFLWRPFDL